MKNNLIYYIMTYVMYLYPPLIYGLLMINFSYLEDIQYWTIGFGVNLVFVVVTTLVLYLLASRKKIPTVGRDERHHFIFGYIGNIVVFLYVFQYLMNIERFVSVFSLILILVIAYKFLISNQITFKEIFIMSIVFSLLDYVIIIASGNTLFDSGNQFTSLQSNVFQWLFILTIIYALMLYIYKLYLNHQWTILRYAVILFTAFSIAMIYYNDRLEEVIATSAILAVFAMLIDIILRIIHKEFKALDLVFYARIIIVSVILVLIKELELYLIPRFNIGQMFLLIAIFYVTCFADIIQTIVPKKDKYNVSDFTVEGYIKELYKSVLSRYKDVLLFDNEKEMITFDKLGRDIIVKHHLDAYENIDLESVSLMIVHTNKTEDINFLLEHEPNINLCIVSDKPLKHDQFKTSFTDFKYYVYTI